MCSELELQPHPTVFIRVASYPNSTFVIVHSFASAVSGASSSWVMVEIPSELLSLLHFPTYRHWCPLYPLECLNIMAKDFFLCSFLVFKSDFAICIDFLLCY